jgi:hypothetical protein
LLSALALPSAPSLALLNSFTYALSSKLLCSLCSALCSLLCVLCSLLFAFCPVLSALHVRSLLIAPLLSDF